MPANKTPAARNQYAADLALLVDQNKEITAAWLDTTHNPQMLILCRAGHGRTQHFNVPRLLQHLPITIRTNITFQTLIAVDRGIDPRNIHQQCQDEPIHLGTQIQPAAATWVGTGGSPARWTDPPDDQHYGILSNWHVMMPDKPAGSFAIHQPDDQSPRIATVARCSPVDPGARNLVDACVADANVDGYHTISGQVLGYGALQRTPLNAYVGMQVMKSGRTTQLTYAHCAGTGAAVQVGYGDFTATFQDQDIFEDDRGQFSAAGDSGSLIVTAHAPAPVSLLFAGGANMTIGNPMRHVIDALQLHYPF